MMEISDELWKEVGFVTSSTYRTKVLKSLDGEIKMPSEIANDTGILVNHMSNTLRQLKEHELVECLNPANKKGRLYRLTDKGEKVHDKLLGIHP